MSILGSNTKKTHISWHSTLLSQSRQERSVPCLPSSVPVTSFSPGGKHSNSSDNLPYWILNNLANVGSKLQRFRGAVLHLQNLSLYLCFVTYAHTPRRYSLMLTFSTAFKTPFEICFLIFLWVSLCKLIFKFPLKFLTGVCFSLLIARVILKFSHTES